MGLNINKIQSRIRKVIQQFPSDVVVYRDQFNKYKEPMADPLKVCRVTGFYHKEKSSLNINIGEAGRIVANKKEYLMIILDDEGKKIQEGDWFERNGVKYGIEDLGENFGIYNDMLLKRM